MINFQLALELSRASKESQLDLFSRFSNFIKDNAWLSSLLGVIIGSIITVVTTGILERGKEKREMSRSKLEKELIPYCSELEAAIKRCEQIIALCKSKNHESWISAFNRVPERKEIIETLLKPTDHLLAERRVYLPKNDRERLEQYAKQVQAFDDQWDRDSELISGSIQLALIEAESPRP